MEFTDVRDKLVRGRHVSDVSPRTATSKVATREPWQPGDPIAVHISGDRIESTSGNGLRVEASDVASSWGKRPDWICADEIVEWRRPELWQAMWPATGKRPRSRVICISTAGWDKSHFSWGIVELAQAEDDWYYSSRPQCASWIDPKWLARPQPNLPEQVEEPLDAHRQVAGLRHF